MNKQHCPECGQENPNEARFCMHCGTSLIDQSVDPGDDFNAYVNGIWIASNEIPGDRQRYGAFDMLREEAIYDVRRLVTDLVASDPAPGTSARRIVDAYNAYLNTEAIDAHGLAPAQPYLDAIRGTESMAELATQNLLVGLRGGTPPNCLNSEIFT